MVPANALAFLVNDTQSPSLDVLEDEASKGPAPPSKTSPSGQRSYFEACAATAKMKNVRGLSYHVLAKGHGLWLSYTTRFRLSAFLDEAKDRGFSCAGIWNSEMDDFANLCNSGHYPLLTSAAHEFFTAPK
ncbi:uncharacterized protein LOC142581846 [Dermacentor variabilis]|uniref:uncharacterized protein LOC142581846 n=1 Tax=Dermacentor variabilis TaxID=34621 RepID=UPI003F5BF151